MVSKITNALEESIVSLLLVGMTLLVFAEVIMRFLFNSGFMWMEEVTLTLSAWFVLFGMSYGVKVGGHIGVDAFVKSLPEKTRKVTAIIAVLLCLVYCCFFLYGSWIYIAKMYGIGITMDDVHLPLSLVNLMSADTAWDVFKIDAEEPLVPLWISQSILLIGFVMLFYRFFQLLIMVIQGKTEGFKFADEAEESMHLIQTDENEATSTTDEKDSAPSSSNDNKKNQENS